MRNVFRVSISLDSDEARRLVRIGLVPNCLQKLSADVSNFVFITENRSCTLWNGVT